MKPEKLPVMNLCKFAGVFRKFSCTKTFFKALQENCAKFQKPDTPGKHKYSTIHIFIEKKRQSEVAGLKDTQLGAFCP